MRGGRSVPGARLPMRLKAAYGDHCAQIIREGRTTLRLAPHVARFQLVSPEGVQLATAPTRAALTSYSFPGARIEPVGHNQ